MSFSQSLSLGEQTLFQLDMCEGKIHCTDKNVTNNNKNISAMANRSIKLLNGKSTSVFDNNLDHQSPSPHLSNGHNDVIDESPTEKTNVLGISIRERLKNASSSKKSERKYLRRSRSDPINGANKSKRLFDEHGQSEDIDLFLDSIIEWDEKKSDSHTTDKKSKVSQKLDEKFESDDFDKYFNDIQTPQIQRDQIVQNDQTKNNSPIVLCDSDEMRMEVDLDEINVSEVKRLMQTEKFDKTVDQLTEKTENTYDHLNDGIEWEDSAFFNDLLTSQQNNENGTEPMEEVQKSMADVVIDTECISMRSGLPDTVEEELESCFLEVSLQLSNLNAIETKSEIPKMASQLSTSISSRSFTERSINVQNNNNITTAVNDGEHFSLALPKQISTQSIDNLIEWNCSAAIVKAYKKKGILEMFEWQAECLNKPKIKDGMSNLLYSAPTSAGKTFVSEILMFQTVLKRQKKVIVILPFISVVREKMYSLQDLLRSSGIRVEGFFGGHTAPGGFENTDIAICTIEKANAIVNRLLEQKNIDAIGMIVVDEVHLISDSNRGYILELLLTKILFCSRKLNANIRIVAMSATLPNAELVRNWLNAEFYQTDYRPIELREMIKIGKQIFDNSMNPVRVLTKDDYALIENDPDNIAQLCIETIANGAAVIVFCPSKDWCEKLAIHVAQNIYKLGKSQTPIGERIRKEINLPMIEEIKGHLKNSPAGLDCVLDKSISYGVAFHHAGLTYDERDIIESAFCRSTIRAIVATSTLSSGVNLPARRVLIRTPMFGGKQMCTLTYHQMIGRAGRMGKDTEGESILICSNARENKIGQELIAATMKPITSCLADDRHSHLKRALLEVIASGVAETRDELEAFVKCTLFHSEQQFEIKYFDQILEEYKANLKHPKRNLKSIDDTFADDGKDVDFVGNCMRFLKHYEFIRLQFDDEIQELKFESTPLGYACLASSMPPTDGFLLFSELQKARENFVLETDLHAVYLVTPFSVCYQLQDIDWMLYWDMWENLSAPMQRVGKLVGVNEAFLARATRGANKLDNRILQIHKRFYTALVLHDLINECSLTTAATKYKLNRGILQSLQQTTSSFAGIVKSFCKALHWDLMTLIVSQFQDRIFFGVHQDLVELLKISVLNGKRARALFNAGYQTLIDISKASVLSIEKCLMDSVGFDVQKRDGETNYDAEQRNKHLLLHVTGRAGMSVKDVAQIIIDEARHYIRTELGIESIAWSQQSKDEGKINGNGTTSNGNGLATIPESTNNNNISIGQQQQPIKKRKIPLDEEVVTPKKRSNHGRINGRERSSSSELSSENSDVDAIDLNSSPILYNDENDNFIEQLQPSNNNTHKNGVAAQQLHIIDVVKNANEFNKFVKSFENATECGFSLCIAQIDPISKSKRYRCLITSERYVYGVSICFQDKYTVHFLSLHDDDGTVEFTKRIAFVQKRILTQQKLTLQIDDAKTQLNTLLMVIPGVYKVDCQIEDSQIAQWLIQPEEARSFSKLCDLYAPNCIDLSNTISSGRTTITTSTKIRSAIKACMTRQILPAQSQKLRQMGIIYNAYKEMEIPVQMSLLHMEQTGMALDRNQLEELSEEISSHIGELETEIFRLNGYRRFAVSSSREVAQALRIRTKNGSIAAKCTRSQLLKCEHPMAKLILEHRSLHAILSKSIQPLVKKTRENNRIYGTSFSFTQTGRISMHEPNLQNVAKDFQTQFRPKVFSCRRAFSVQPHRMLISADFCQLELRVLAHLSEDHSLVSIFSTFNDVFISIAAKWNNVAESDVTEKMRNNSKQICYGIIYGMGVKSLALAMNCDEEEAQSLHESFHQTYPGIRKYTQKILNSARENGYVETLAGRRRYIPDINATNNPRKCAKAERQAINTTIQGSAADIAKYAILRMERNLLKYQNKLQINSHANPLDGINLVLHLHDELLYEVPSENAVKVLAILKSSMENCARLSVPLKVKLKKGQNWGSMSQIELK